MESPVNAQDHRAESPGMISLLKFPCELKPIDLEMVSKQAIKYYIDNIRKAIQGCSGIRGKKMRSILDVWK